MMTGYDYQNDRESANLRIEQAHTSHVPIIAEIERQSWLSTYPNAEHGITADDVVARFADMSKREHLISMDMDDQSHHFFIVRKDNTIIGYLHLLNGQTFNDLVEIYLLLSEQGKGYGKRLMQFALQQFGNSKPIQLEVAVYNQRAITLYEKFGFVKQLELMQPIEEDWNVLPSGKRIPVVFMVKQKGK